MELRHPRQNLLAVKNNRQNLPKCDFKCAISNLVLHWVVSDII